jgi:hypothetical protein
MRDRLCKILDGGNREALVILRDVFRSFVVFVKKFLSGDILRFHCTDPTDCVIIMIQRPPRSVGHGCPNTVIFLLFSASDVAS